MGNIHLTRKGNIYEESNSGKTLMAATGAVAGGVLANKNINAINKMLNEASSECNKYLMQDFFNPSTKSNQQSRKIVEYAKKGLNFVKKHPIASAAVAAATVLTVTVGNFIDGCVNMKRMAAADKKQNN